MTLTDTSWHDPTFPELRDGPPWLMAEMIAATPELARPILGAPAAADVAAAVVAAARARDPIVVVGCGTSLHGAMAVADLLEAALERASLRGSVEARDALEAALQPRAGGLAIGVSHDGATRATALALEAATLAGARTGLLTRRADEAVAKHAELVLETTLHDRSWCHTVAFSSAILAGAAIAERVAPQGLDGGAAEARLRELLERTGAAVDPAAAALLPGRLTIATGSGADRVTARELGLKLEEGAHRPTAHRDLEMLLHGHLVACGDDTPIVLVAVDDRGRPRRLERARHLLDAAVPLGAPVVGILDAQAAESLGGHPALRAVVPTGRATLPTPLDAILAGAVALQTLTLAAVHHAGTNPDLIRREQEPWRTAAAALDGGGW